MTARLTTTEGRILSLLSDGRPHTRMELLACLPDSEYATPRTLQVHVSNLRDKLQPGEAIYHVTRNGPSSYILIRFAPTS